LSDLTLTIGERDFTVEFEVVNQATGGAFDLTPYDNIRLFIKTTDYLTDIVPGGIILGTIAPPTKGILAWSIIASQVPTVAGQYYGKVDFEDTGSGEVRKSEQFDIRITRSLSS